MARIRVPEERDKSRLLQTIEHARDHFKLRTVLRLIGMTHGRYNLWTREECHLDDRESCPASSPQQLTPTEVSANRDMVTSEEYRHVPTGTLARLAQPLGKVFASASTWYWLVRIHKWRRPRQRIHPAKPKVGVRASKPNEVWHIDATIIRLLDGSRAWLHAVIDNYSRRILAWRVLGTLELGITAQMIMDAHDGIKGKPMVVADGDRENFNESVDKLVKSNLLQRVRAHTEIRSSNPMIESWWRVLKHQWLFLNRLDSVRSVENLVSIYVEQHNTHLPHSAFAGQTPDELYYGTGDEVPEDLSQKRIAARKSRLETNRNTCCQQCEELVQLGS